MVMLLISATVFAGGRGEADGDQERPVEIYMKAMGAAPDGLPAVIEAFNENLLEDINATIRIDYYTWSDWGNKYRLDMVSGEPIDIIYTATWTNFADYASDGAFVDLAPLLPEFAPELWAAMPEDRWAAATTPGGEIFAIPSMNFQPGIQGMAYREDLRQEYGLAPIETLEDLEALMIAVAENEPEMRGLGNSVLRMWANLPIPYHTAYINNLLYIDERNPLAPMQTPLDFRDELIEWSSIVRGYYDAGLFSHDVLANISSPRAAETDFDIGLIPVNSRNQEHFAQSKLVLEAENPGWEIGFLPSYRSERGTFPKLKGVFQDATAFPIAGRNTERALQFVELVLLDPYYHTLLNYGVEGEHFTRVDSQSIRIPEDTDWPDAGMWGLRNSALHPDRAGDAAAAIMDEIESAAADFIMSDHARNFIVFDMSPVQSTIAALNTIIDEMFAPLRVGLYPMDEIPARVDEYLAALENAGVRRVQEYVQQYWQLYTDRL